MLKIDNKKVQNPSKFLGNIEGALAFCSIFKIQQTIKQMYSESAESPHFKIKSNSGMFILDSSQTNSKVNTFEKSRKQKEQIQSQYTENKKKRRKFEQPQITKPSQQKNQIKRNIYEKVQKQPQVMSAQVLLHSMQGSAINLLDSARSNNFVNTNSKFHRSLSPSPKVKYETPSSERQKFDSKSCSPIDELRKQQKISTVRYQVRVNPSMPKIKHEDIIQKMEHVKMEKKRQKQNIQDRVHKINRERAVSEFTIPTSNKNHQKDLQKMYIQSIGNKYMQAILQNYKKKIHKQ